MDFHTRYGKDRPGAESDRRGADHTPDIFDRPGGIALTGSTTSCMNRRFGWSLDRSPSGPSQAGGTIAVFRAPGQVNQTVNDAPLLIEVINELVEEHGVGSLVAPVDGVRYQVRQVQ